MVLDVAIGLQCHGVMIEAAKEKHFNPSYRRAMSEETTFESWEEDTQVDTMETVISRTTTPKIPLETMAELMDHGFAPYGPDRPTRPIRPVHVQFDVSDVSDGVPENVQQEAAQKTEMA
jgi:hypothetical protein